MVGRAILLGVSLLIPTAFASAGKQVAVPGSDVTFDAAIKKKIAGETVTLVLTGTALREKFWLNVYAIGSYVEKGTRVNGPEALAAADVPKKLHLVLERDVEGDSMADALKESVLANHPKQFTKELKTMCNYVRANPVNQGDHVWFTHLPGEGLICKISHEPEVTIKSVAFARAVWEIYFGKKNIGVAIKKGLSSRL